MEERTMADSELKTKQEAGLNLPSLWIFGYGSLMWNPGFPYRRRQVGFVHNYKREFYQGNTNCRGTEKQPGRVACIVENQGSLTWGMAFDVVGEEDIRKAMEHLEQRETKSGGYVSLQLDFHPREDPDQPFQVRVYSVTPDNPQYLGPAPLPEMAAQIVAARDHAGPNIDYVTKLADFVHSEIPEDQDRDLFQLDTMVRQLQANRARGQRA